MVWDKIKEEQYKMVSNVDESNWLNLVYSAKNINDDSVVWKYVLLWDYIMICFDFTPPGKGVYILAGITQNMEPLVSNR